MLLAAELVSADIDGASATNRAEIITRHDGGRGTGVGCRACVHGAQGLEADEQRISDDAVAILARGLAPCGERDSFQLAVAPCECSVAAPPLVQYTL